MYFGDRRARCGKIRDDINNIRQSKRQLTNRHHNPCSTTYLYINSRASWVRESCPEIHELKVHQARERNLPVEQPGRGNAPPPVHY